MPLLARLPERPAPEPLLRLESSEAELRVLGSRGNDHSFRVAAPAATQATFFQYYFSGWRLEIDGKAAELRAEPTQGICAMEIAAGVHDVRLHFAPTPARATARWGASAAVIGCLCALVWRRRRRGRRALR
jgi:hypothetical protein